MNPNNSRIGVMNILKDSINKDVRSQMNSHYFRADYIGWNPKNEYPECRVIGVFGKFGDIEIETAALLRTNGVEDIEHDDDKVH